MEYEKIMMKLSQSHFRNHFHLQEKEKQYIHEKGITTIENHAHDFIAKRLAPATIPNDGKQTPMHGHPVFIAQHATATCCRQCLYKWHHIPPHQQLTQKQQEDIVQLIMIWIKKEVEIKK